MLHMDRSAHRAGHESTCRSLDITRKYDPGRGGDGVLEGGSSRICC